MPRKRAHWEMFDRIQEDFRSDAERLNHDVTSELVDFQRAVDDDCWPSQAMAVEALARWHESVVQRKESLEHTVRLQLYGAQQMAPPEDPFAMPRVRAKS